MPTKKMKKERKVKAWAVLGEDVRSIVSVEFGRSRPRTYTIGTWIFGADTADIVPCTITYQIPNKK